MRHRRPEKAYLLAALLLGAAPLPGCAKGQSEGLQALAAEAGSDPRHLDTARQQAAKHQKNGPTLTLLSYNVNYKRRRLSTAQVVGRLDADVVLLQETTPAWQAFLLLTLGGRYPHVAFHHSRGAGGLAVLSRYPFETRRIIPSVVGKFPAWQLVVRTPFGPVQLFNLHLRPLYWRGPGSVISRYYRTQKTRLTETREVLRHVDPRLPTVLAGDFNEDIHGKSLALLLERGFVSAALGKAAGAPTWRWRGRSTELRWQLDHVLHGPRLVTRLFRVVEAGASDHFPLLVVLQPRREAAARAP